MDSEESTESTSAARERFDSFRQRPRRQQFLAGFSLFALVVVVLLLVVVPLQILGLAINDTATFEATAATPDTGTLTDVAYELNDSDTVTANRQLSPAGQQRTIVVENPQRIYRKNIAVQNRTVPTGIFATTTTPAITIAGQSQNPIADMNHLEVLQRFQSELDIGDGDLTFEKTSEYDAVLVGSPTTVSAFKTNISFEGEPQEFRVYVTTGRSNGDIVIAVGAHPTAFPDERVSILRLFYAVTHAGDTTAGEGTPE